MSTITEVRPDVEEYVKMNEMGGAFNKENPSKAEQIEAATNANPNAGEFIKFLGESDFRDSRVPKTAGSQVIVRVSLFKYSKYRMEAIDSKADELGAHLMNLGKVLTHYLHD